MHRQQLEHIIRAAAGITGATEFVIVGSQSVLGQFPQAPDELLISIEADVFSLRDPLARVQHQHRHALAFRIEVRGRGDVQPPVINNLLRGLAHQHFAGHRTIPQ
jgi:hypothetical protein